MQTKGKPMQTNVVTALVSGSAPAAAQTIIARLESDTSPALVLVFASTAQPLAEVVQPIQAAFPDAVVLGSSTAGEFVEDRDAKGSVAAIALYGDFKAFAGLGTGLHDDPDGAVMAAVERLPRTVDGYEHCTGLVLLDPLAGHGEEATLLAATAIGEGRPIPLAGGAAGDDLVMKATTVSVGDAARTDAIAVAVVYSKRPLGIGVHHGHAPLSRPLRVTKTSGGVVEEIEGRPAWEVWAEHTRAAAAATGVDVDTLPDADLGAFLLRYEAGLQCGGGYKIRAPLARKPGGGLLFATEVPEGSVIRITESTPSRQIDSAREAARHARIALQGVEPAGAVVFDCICRNLILGDRFVDAIKGISEELGGVPLAGFETYGEIALDVGDMSGFHNTTTVVLAFPR
jgi:methyl-accepting chemotaxis protein